MTARVVSLRDEEASDARTEGTIAARVSLVASLSEAQWILTRRPLPTYTRTSMPIAVTTLRARARSD